VEEDEESSIGSILNSKDEFSVLLDPVRRAVTITKLRERLASISATQIASMKVTSRLRYLDISRLRLE
jgi:hypothetical protein